MWFLRDPLAITGTNNVADDRETPANWMEEKIWLLVLPRLLREGELQMNINTAKSLLALPEEELIRIASEKFVEKPWEHTPQYICRKCGKHTSETRNPTTSCPVPGPIKLDWNTAMELYRKIGPQLVDIYLRRIWEVLIEIPDDGHYITYEMWKDEDAQPRHYIIAAILAQEPPK